MEGFFTEKETQSISRPGGKSYTCITCGLYKKCSTPRMAPFGKFKKKILNIGEAPGETEDKTGKPWQGKVGRLLKETYASMGIDLFEDCLNINAAMCRPTNKDGSNRSPSNFEVECCRKRVLLAVEEYKPRLIIILGNSGLLSLIGHRWKRDLGGITKWRGFTIPDQDYKAWLCPTYHPSFVERSFLSSYSNQDKKSVEYVIWKQDLQQAFDLLQTHTYQGKTTSAHPFPIYKEPVIEIIDDLSILNKIKSGEVAFDYETTGLKPHAPGHKIVCASVATSPNFAYVFLMPKKRKDRQPFLNLLANKNVGKIAQNMKYEDTWSIVQLEQQVVNWVWDTMLFSHVLDNRAGVTGLKFQVYVNFGIVDYSSEVAPYFESSDSKDGNGINKIFDILKTSDGKRKLLKYCAYDSINEFRLAEKQRLNLLPF